MASRSIYNAGRLIVSVFMPLFLAGSALAQISALPPSAGETGLGGVNSVVGTVLGPSGTPVARRIRIKLSSTVMGDRIAMTDENGNFAFRGLPSGNYAVIIDREKEFETLTLPVGIIQLRGMPAQTYTMNIRLTLKAGTEPKPGVVNAEFAKVPQKAVDFYHKALELTKTGDNEAAIEQLQLAIAEHPTFTLAFSELGVQYLRLNELQKADESLQAALKIVPESFNPLVNRGIVLVAMKRFQEAEPVLRNALKIKEDSAVAHYFLGQAVANLGRFDEAEKERSASIKLGGDEMKEAHRILAIIFSAKGDKKRAADELETYLRISPTAPDADQLRKVILQLKGIAEPTPATPSNTKPGS